jgi:putative membrane protein insertion efficiency factor
LKLVFIFLIRLYQIILSPLKPYSTCRYIPTCSEYSIQAIKKHGPWHGLWLAIKRISRCHPFHSGGYDPVP